MITFSILFILLYSYSICKIRKESKSWKDFDSYDSNLFVHLIFIFGTAALIIVVLSFGSYMVINNIVP